MDLNDLLDDLSSTTKAEFSSMPEVVDGTDDLDVSTLPITARKWTSRVSSWPRQVYASDALNTAMSDWRQAQT